MDDAGEVAFCSAPIGLTADVETLKPSVICVGAEQRGHSLELVSRRGYFWKKDQNRKKKIYCQRCAASPELNRGVDCGAYILLAQQQGPPLLLWIACSEPEVEGGG